MKISYAFALSALIGCGSTEDIFPDPDNTTSTSNTTTQTMGEAGGEQSGSRIKHKYIESSDGATQYTGLYDSELKVDCGFVRASDGDYRCIPSSGIVAFGYYYLDANCTGELVMRATPCDDSAPSHITIYKSSNGNACASEAHVYEPGAKFAGDTVYLKSASTCFAQSVTTGYDYYVVGPEISIEAFASAEMKTE